MGLHYVGQAGLELLTSGDLTTLASQSAEITGCEPLRPAFYYVFITVLRLSHHICVRPILISRLGQCLYRELEGPDLQAVATPLDIWARYLCVEGKREEGLSFTIFSVFSVCVFLFSTIHFGKSYFCGKLSILAIEFTNPLPV